jgi:hypothetical protein
LPVGRQKLVADHCLLATAYYLLFFQSCIAYSTPF